MASELGLKHTCPGNCGRSHACPVRVNGWTCNGDHSPDKCPNKGKAWTLLDPQLIAGMIQRAGKRAPRMTSQSGLRLMGQETWRITLCQSQEVQEDFPKPSRGESPLAPPLDLLQLQQLFPWTASLPERLQQGLLWDPSVSPYEVQTPAQLLLYTGKADSQSLDSVLLSRQSQLEGHIIALDIKRSEDQDILRGDLYSQLCVSAWNGNIQKKGGGPNCRTWSILRWFPKPGFPKPVRGRREPDCWGFSVLETSEAQDTDKDSLLLLRQLLLSHISKMRYKGPGLPWCFLEHPEDPKLCSTSPSAVDTLWWVWTGTSRR